MPKRVIDGEGLWRSDKLAQVQPGWIKSEYANLIPLALANGSFEANPRRVWSTVYSYNRPEVTPEQVEQILAELHRVKLLFRWTDQESGKAWGYWTGIEKPGRLPGKSRRGRNEAVGLEPPADELRKFLESNGIHRALDGNEKLLGFGSGFGSGINPSSELKGSSDQVNVPTPKKTSQPPSSEACRLAALLKSEILRNKPDYKITLAQERKWALTADRMLRIDNRTSEQVAAVIQWAQSDEFWMGNILSMDTLREKFDQLSLKMQVHGRAAAPVKLPADYVSASEKIRRERLAPQAVAQ